MPGDRVRVRTLEEILATLDTEGRCDGCYFVRSMARHCGQEFPVLKVVERYYDEKQRRMLRCRNTVFLEGACCDGACHPDTTGCDRTCLSFWRAEWLEKLDSPGD